MLYALIKIEDLKLRNIHIAKAGQMIADVKMEIKINLSGKFTARDQHTKSEASVSFNGQGIRNKNPFNKGVVIA